MWFSEPEYVYLLEPKIPKKAIFRILNLKNQFRWGECHDRHNRKQAACQYRVQLWFVLLFS